MPVHRLLWPARVLSALLEVTFSPFILILWGYEGTGR